MPSKSKAQHKFMAAVANNPQFARRAGVPQSVGREYMKADEGRSFKEGGDLVKEVPKDNPGLAKLPEPVRNKMGYMARGGNVKGMKKCPRDGIAQRGRTRGTMR